MEKIICLLIDWSNNLYGARLKWGRKNFRFSEWMGCNFSIADKLKNGKQGIFFILMYIFVAEVHTYSKKIKPGYIFPYY